MVLEQLYGSTTIGILRAFEFIKKSLEKFDNLSSLCYIVYIIYLRKGNLPEI